MIQNFKCNVSIQEQGYNMTMEQVAMGLIIKKIYFLLNIFYIYSLLKLRVFRKKDALFFKTGLFSKRAFSFNRADLKKKLALI